MIVKVKMDYQEWLNKNISIEEQYMDQAKERPHLEDLLTMDLKVLKLNGLEARSSWNCGDESFRYSFMEVELPDHGPSGFPM